MSEITFIDNEIECSNPEKSKVFIDFNHFVDSMTKRIKNLLLNDKANNEIFKLFSELVKQSQAINSSLFADYPDAEHNQILEMSTEYVCGKLRDYSTAYSYRRQKDYEKNELFVCPKEYSLGLKWEMKRDTITKVAVPRMTECKFSYVSMVDSLKAV